MKEVFKSSSQASSIEAEEDQFLELIKLPSLGKLYAEDHPLCDEETVEVKHMTAVEENILTSVGLVKSGKFVDVLMKSVLRNKSIDPTDLFIGDKNAILIGIRVASFGPEYSVNMACQNKACSKEFVNTFLLNELEVKSYDDADLPKEVLRTERNEFETVLPVTKSKVKFKLLTQRELDDLEQTQENRKKALLKRKINVHVDSFVTDKLVTSIISVDGKSSKDAISRWVMKLPIKDSRYINNLMKRIEPKIILRQQVSCPHCGTLKDMAMPLTVDFFWPAGDDDDEL